MTALQGTSLPGMFAVATGGEFSGRNSGITIGQVMPEEAEGRPLTTVRDGDRIVIDLTRRRLDLCVEKDVLKTRSIETGQSRR